ncbi:MAG: hypothetical protein AB3N15_05945 [Paracoccaceae bacterium]
MAKDSPKTICNDTLGLAMEAQGLAIALDDAVFNSGCLAGLPSDTSAAIHALAKALRTATEEVLVGIEDLDKASARVAKDGAPKTREAIQ